MNLTLTLVTDRRGLAPGEFYSVVREAAEGGVTAVQLREKNASKAEIVDTAHELIKLLSPLNIPLIINDFVDIAKEVGAQGVHLGNSDGDPQTARKILGPNAIIGISVEHESVTNIDGCDYLSASPVFSTDTKKDIAPPLGIEGVKKLRANTTLPLIAIGGINEANASLLGGLGIEGIAVVSAIMWSKDPKGAAQRLLQEFRRNYG